PALISDGRLLTENVAILDYVARSAPAAGLSPDDAFDQARMLSLTAWFASTVHITGRMARAPFRFTPDETTYQALKTEGRTRFEANLHKIDALLTDRDWLIGDRMSVADAYALVFYAWGVAGEHPVAGLNHYSALARRMAARPGVQRAMAREKTPPFPVCPRRPAMRRTAIVTGASGALGSALVARLKAADILVAAVDASPS